MNPLIAKLNKQIEDATTEQETLLNTAEAAGRDLTEDESKRFDALTTDIAKAKAGIERAKAVEGNKKYVNEPGTKPIVQPPHDPQNAADNFSIDAVTIPAKCKRHNQLKAFRGADADKRAYLSGLWVAGAFYGHDGSLSKLAEYGLTPRRNPNMATLTSTDNTRGGYFVPDVMDTTIIELTEEYGVIRRLADVVPMSSDTWKGPKWNGGMTATWVTHGTAPSQSEPTWTIIELVAKDLAAYGKMTVQLNEDAIIDLGDKWAMAAALAFAYAEDNAAFNGDGTSSYGGITGLLTAIIASANSASLSTATGHTTLSALTLNDFWAVVGKLPRYPGISPRWLCHQEVYAASMGPLQTAAGGVTPQDIANGGIPRFLGYPVEFVNVMPRAASVTSGVTGILFGDLSLSTKFGDRRSRAMRVGEINDDMIKQLLTLFTAERVDIINHTLTDPKDSTKPGPVIGLKLG